MKNIVVLFIVSLISSNVCGQTVKEYKNSSPHYIQHWEDSFWQDEAKKHYKKTLTLAGTYVQFYANGQIKWQGKCLANGTPDSTWVYYNEKGQVIWEGDYNGKYYEYKYNYDYEEPIQPYYEDGLRYKEIKDTIIIGNYKNGLKDGEWLVYDYSGKYIRKKGQYINGEPTGIWQEFQDQPKTTSVIKKSSEYDYSTKTKTIYKNDSLKKQHIAPDSLPYNEGTVTYSTNGYTQSEYYRVNFDLIASAQYVDFKQLNNYFSQTGHQNFKVPLYSFGVGFSGISDELYWSYVFNYTPAITQQINDSVKLRLSGYNTSLHFGKDFIKSKYIDLAPTLGVGFQQLKLTATKTLNPNASIYGFNEGDYKVYKNPAVTVNGMLNLRFNIGEVSFNFGGGVVIQCSSGRWRYNGDYLIGSPKTSISGFIATCSIGFEIEND